MLLKKRSHELCHVTYSVLRKSHVTPAMARNLLNNLQKMDYRRSNTWQGSFLSMMLQPSKPESSSAAIIARRFRRYGGHSCAAFLL